MEFSLDPQRGAGRVAATFKLTPAMLACLEGQPGRATVTTSASGDKVLRVGDNSFTFTSHPDVPADLIRGGAFDARPGTSADPAPHARVAASLRCHLKHKRPLTGTDGVAASVKRRAEQADGDRRARKALVVDYIAPEPREPHHHHHPRGRRGETAVGDASTSAANAPRRVIRAPPKPKPNPNPKPKPSPSPSVAAPSARISERLAALAAAAARAASGRAANQLRAALLVILSERPLTFAAAHAAVTAGLAAANLSTPHRSAVEEAVKRVASYRAPGRYHVDAAFREEGAELLRAAEAEAPATVLTPPLRVPSSVGFARGGGMIDRDIAAGLTDEEGGNTPDHAPGGARETAESDAAAAAEMATRPRAVGDDDDAWMAYIPEANAAKEWTSARTQTPRADGGWGDATISISSDEEFRRRRAAFNREYATYAKTHAALEANAREFAALRERRDAAVARGEASAAGLTRRMAEFRVIRHERYAEMMRVFEHLEAKLGAVKRALKAYAK